MMTVFGDKQSFALELRPLPEPLLNGQPGSDPVESCTWAAWQLWVDDVNLCRHSDLARATVNEDVFWPLGSIVDWLVTSWDELFYERAWLGQGKRHPRNARDYFDQLNRELRNFIEEGREDDPLAERLMDERDRIVAQHSLVASSRGGAVPDVYFSRDGNNIRVAWRASHSPRICFHYEHGEHDVPASSFLDVCRKLVEWNIGRLREASLPQTSERITRLMRWLTISPEVAARDALLHATGLKEKIDELEQATSLTFEELLELPESWRESGPTITPSISSISMAFRCASPTVSLDDLKTIRELLLDLDRQDDGWTSLTRLANILPRSLRGLRDFEEGYEYARAVRNSLVNPDEFLDVEDFVSQQLHVPIVDRALMDKTVDGAAVWGPERGPTIIVNSNSARAQTQHGRRAVIAHELCHLLVDRRQITNLAILSGPWAPPRLERRANAFAAELLLPRQGIRRFFDVSEGVLNDDVLAELMDEFQVGSTLATHHVNNRLKLS